MTGEFLDVVNGRDEVVGRRRRSEVHRLGLKHRAVHVLVFNSRGEVFLQKRSRAKDTAPGLWDSSASGHVDSGEDYDACAERELREEIGLRVAEPPARVARIEAAPETGWEFCRIYRCASEGPFRLNPDEIERGAWFSREKLEHWLGERPADFASSFRAVWRVFNRVA